MLILDHVANFDRAVSLRSSTSASPPWLSDPPPGEPHEEAEPISKDGQRRDAERPDRREAAERHHSSHADNKA